MFRRFLLLVSFLLIASVLAAPFPVVAASDATNFIQTFGNQALAVIRSSAAPAHEKAYLHQVLEQDFDLVAISRFVLGPYWRNATGPERQEFESLLQDYLVRFYGQRFAEYSGESFHVTGSRLSDPGEIVTSQIIRRQGPPIEVDWRLNAANDAYQITDVIVGGVSMALTHHAEFASMIQRGGGQIAGLLAAMQAQIAEGVGSSTPTR